MNSNTNIIDMSRSEIKDMFDDTISNNASNNKVTYGKFRWWDKLSKNFINQLITVLSYLDHSDKKQYYSDIIKHFYNVNNIVSDYNKSITDHNKLYVYKQAVHYYFIQNKDILDQKDLDNMLDWYKRYRGMSNLSEYNGDLSHPKLIDRTIQYMQESDLKKYMNTLDVEIDWKIAVEKYKSNIVDAL